MSLLHSYPILDVSLPPFSSVSNTIGRGKGRIWGSYGDSKWLFKFPRAMHGEHWAEKISSELASLLEISFPRVEFARCVGFDLRLTPDPRVRRSHRDVVGRHGALVHTYSPLPPSEGGPVIRGFLISGGEGMVLEGYDPGESSYISMPGGDVLALSIGDFNRSVRSRSSNHNVKDVIRAWSHLAGVGSMNPLPLWDVALEELASYVLLAALVSNTDRNFSN